MTEAETHYANCLLEEVRMSHATSTTLCGMVLVADVHLRTRFLDEDTAVGPSARITAVTCTACILLRFAEESGKYA